MEENLPNAEANYRALEKLMVEPENKKCADCTGSSEDGYLSLDYGTFICFYCAEIHRTLKHRVKKVAANNVRDEDLSLMRANGNRKSYDQWLVRYKGDYPEPDGSSKDRTKRTEYLHLKYDEKKWARPDAAPIPPSTSTSSAEETSLTRSRSTSSPPAFTPGVANPFTSNYYGPSPSEVHMIHQQQLQHQLLANQQHLQQQQIHQQMLQQQLHQNQQMLQQQYLQQQQQQQYLQQSQQQQQYLQQQQQQQQQQQSQQQHSPPKNHLTQSLTQAPETRNRSPSLTNSLPPSYTYASPPPVAIPPVLSPRGVSPMPNGTSSPAPVSPTNVASPTASGGMVGGRTRSNSKIGVCPQCGAGVDSREMGKHKLKECPYRSTAVQGV